jgi:hypothetical protein
VTTRIKIDVAADVRGVVLEGKGGPIMREFFDKAKTLVAKTGQDELKQRASSAPKHPKGRFSDSIVVKDFAKGRTIMADYPQTLYGPWLEGTSTRNESTRFKGYRMFKLTRGRLRKNVGPLVQDLFNEAVAKLRGGAT